MKLQIHFCLPVLFIALLIAPYTSFSVSISGKVSGKNNEPLPFATAFIKGTANGTTANADGFYRLEVNSGNHVIVFKYIGYRTLEKEISVLSYAITLDVMLEQENYSLKEVVITASSEDPAYEIIRKAQAQRKFYLEQVDAYSCMVYIKGLQRMKDWPKKVLGQEVQIGNLIDTTTGIIYFSESVSEFHFQNPDNIREVMISSKVSGSNRAFSFNRAGDLLVNFYENSLFEGELNTRGFISPIAPSAFIYYKYRLIGSFEENGFTIHNIEVIPKRKHDPVFAGNIFIADGDWRIHSVDLLITKESQIEFVDTLRVSQVLVPVDSAKKIWMPFSTRYDFTFSAFGFKGNGYFLELQKDYNMQPVFAKNFFTGELMKVNDDANKRDSSYWETMRLVPLTVEEIKDYSFKDSIRTIRESKTYLDSIDRKSNKGTIGKIFLTGYTYTQRYKKQSFSITPLLQNVQFNTVEGLAAFTKLDYTKRYENRKSFSIGTVTHYGFANKTWQASGSFVYNMNPLKFSSIALEGGKNLVQFNEENPVLPLMNTYYSLWARLNYMKLFQNEFAALRFKHEIINGLLMNVSAEYARRSAAVNHSNYAFVKTKREYASNDPLFPQNNQPSFEQHNALITKAEMKIWIKQKYITRPDIKLNYGSDFPELSLNYSHGWNHVEFGKWSAAVDDEINAGILGRLSYIISYGDFVNKKKMYFMDAHHFTANQTIISLFPVNGFNNLGYYSHSTAGWFFQAHAEHNFGGFLFNKIPLIRKLKLNEIAGAHYLNAEDNKEHFEFSAGFEKLEFFRFDVVTSFTDWRKPETVIRLGIKITSNQQ